MWCPYNEGTCYSTSWERNWMKTCCRTKGTRVLLVLVFTWCITWEVFKSQESQFLLILKQKFKRKRNNWETSKKLCPFVQHKICSINSAFSYLPNSSPLCSGSLSDPSQQESKQLLWCESAYSEHDQTQENATVNNLITAYNELNHL